MTGTLVVEQLRRPRLARALAWAICGLNVAFVAVRVAFAIRDRALAPIGGTWAEVIYFICAVLAILACSTVGALIASRRPSHPIGWLYCGLGLLTSAGGLADVYGTYALLLFPGTLPGGEVAAWFLNWQWVPFVGLMGTFLVLLFPTGRLLSPRWRIVAWLSGAGILFGALNHAFAPGPLDEIPSVVNPFGVGGAAGVVINWLGLAVPLLIGCVVASAISLFVRYRRGRSQERQQIKWFATASMLLVIALILSLITSDWGVASDLLFVAGTVALPVATGIAILRYRLFDIDLIIRRTLVYGTLTAALALIYFGSVAVLQSFLTAIGGQTSAVATVASTLAIAALFTPLRRRVQDFIDHRFFRRKYDAARTLADFAVAARDETNLEHLSRNLVAVVDQAMQPAGVSLWLLRQTANQSHSSRREGRNLWLA